MSDWYQELYERDAMLGGVDDLLAIRARQRAVVTTCKAEGAFNEYLKNLEREFEPGGKYYRQPCQSRTGAAFGFTASTSLSAQ